MSVHTTPENNAYIKAQSIRFAHEAQILNSFLMTQFDNYSLAGNHGERENHRPTRLRLLAGDDFRANACVIISSTIFKIPNKIKDYSRSFWEHN